MTDKAECPRCDLNFKYPAMPGEFVYKGNLWASWTSEQQIKAVEDTFEFLPTDIILSGYAKSGITLLSEITCLLMYSQGKTQNMKSAIAKVEETPIHLRVPFVEEDWIGPYPMMCQKVQAMEYLDYLREHQIGIPPRLIKTHLPVDSIECALKRMDRNSRPRIIYVYRNPKDVAVSMYHFYCGLSVCGPYRGSWDEFFEMWIDGWISGGDWRRVVPNWLKQAKLGEIAQILPVSYEMLVNDTEACVGNLHCFLQPGNDLDPTVHQSIVERTSFKNMRSNKMTNYDGVEGFVPSFRFMRRGQIGDWKNWFSDDQNARFMTAYEETLGELKQLITPHAIIFE